MATALFCFDDRAAAAEAARSLTAQGLPEEAVQVCGPGAEPAAGDVDELATGGFVHSMNALLQGLFEWGTPGQEKSAYSDVIERGGALVRVEARSPEEQRQAEAAMQMAARHTGWH